MTITRAPSAGAQPATIKRQKDDPAKIQEAATQFEALLINQMLQSARASGGAGTSDDEDTSDTSSLVELSQQQFSQALASSGGLGIAKMVVAGLKSHAN
jgi:flagellar protein FlgJ